MITDKNSGKRDIGIKIISVLICLIVVSFPLSKAADKICYPYVKAKAVAYLCKKYDAKITDFKLIDSRHAGTYWDSSRDELFQFLAWKDFAFEFEYNGRKFFVNRNDGKFYDDYQLEDIENWCTEWLQKNIDENIVGIELIIDNYFNYIANCDKSNNYVLTKSDQYPYGEERRLFYVAITRAKIKTYVFYDKRFPSVFVDEFLHPEKVTEESYVKHPNANKKWTRSADKFLLTLYHEGKSIKYIAEKMGRSQTSIVMRIGKLEGKQ